MNGKPESKCMQPPTIFDPTVLPLYEASYDSTESHDDESRRLLNHFGVFDRFLASAPAADPPCCIPWSGYSDYDDQESDTP
jgi:hypothetical protein